MSEQIKITTRCVAILYVMPSRMHDAYDALKFLVLQIR